MDLCDWVGTDEFFFLQEVFGNLHKIDEIKKQKQNVLKLLANTTCKKYTSCNKKSCKKI